METFADYDAVSGTNQYTTTAAGVWDSVSFRNHYQSFCTVQRGFLSACFSGCTVVNCTVLLSYSFDYKRAILCCSPTQISRYIKTLFIRIFHCNSFAVQMSDELHSCVSRWPLVPEHHSVVSFVMAAENLHCVTRFCDEIRVRLTDLQTQTHTWTERNRDSSHCDR